MGFTDGQQVERDPYLAVYQQVDPRTGETFGRGPYGYKHYTQILGLKVAAEPPHATRERVLELEREAAQETRRSHLFTDMTVAHNKSVSVLHASFREQARRARLAGDSEREAVWRAREGAGDLAPTRKDPAPIGRTDKTRDSYRSARPPGQA